jgi:hypothetical protein
MTTAYEFACGYTKLGVATAPSSAPTITVVDSANNILVAASTATTVLTNLTGAYRYSYSGADGLTCYAMFHTTDTTVDQQDLFALAVINPVVRAAQLDITAIKTVTDQMRFTVTNQVDANALSGGTSPAAIDTLLSTNHGSGQWGAGNGGTKSITDTITDSVTALPIADVVVNLYSDAARTVQIDQQITNALGAYAFHNLIAGTYYLRASKANVYQTADFTKVAA